MDNDKLVLVPYGGMTAARAVLWESGMGYCQATQAKVYNSDRKYRKGKRDPRARFKEAAVDGRVG